MPNSIGQSIEAAILAQLQGQTYAGIDSGAIVKRALPRVGENLSPALVPGIIVAAGEEEESGEQDSFENTLTATYPFEIAVVAAANRDASPKDQLREWRQQAKRCFGDAGIDAIIAAAPQVWNVEPMRGRLFDRAKLADNYLYSSFVLRVHTHEPR